MSARPLTSEEFAVLIALDSGIGRRRPSADMELRLCGLALPARTARGEALVWAGRGAVNDDQC